MLIPGRDAITQALTEEMKEHKQGTLTRKQKVDIKYLIGTMHLLAADRQFARASNVALLMEPT